MMLHEQIESLITPVLKTLGLNIVRVLIIDGGKRKTLQVMIEREDNEPIGLSDCQNASNNISAILDVEDIIKDKYNLEISSPGLSRPLTKLADYDRFKGKYVKIQTTIPLKENTKNYSGKILENKEGIIVIEQEKTKEKIEIPFDMISKSNIMQIESEFRNILKNSKKTNKQKKEKDKNDK